MNAKDIITQSLTKKTGLIIGIILSTIASVTLQIFAILIIRDMVDNVFVKTMSEDPGLAIRVTGFCLSLLISFLLNIFVKSMSVKLGAYTTTELRNQTYSAILRAEQSEINELDETEVVDKLINDTSIIGNNYIGVEWLSFLKGTIMMIGIFITMMVISPILGMVTFVLLPVFQMIMYTFDRFVNRYTFRQNQDIIRQEEKLQEDIEKVRSIKLKNGIEVEEENYRIENENYIENRNKVLILQEMNNGMLPRLLVLAVIAIILGLGGYLSTRGQQIPGTIVSFLIMTPITYYSFSKVMDTGIMPKNIELELSSINDLLSLKSEIRSEPINSLDEVHSLRFEDVSYSSNGYETEGLSFELKRGEKLGVFSLGEATNNLIFDLITKIIRPTEGRITINNCDINKLNTFYLRNIVTAIPEDKTIFNKTIKENIIYPLDFDEYKFNDALNRSGLKDILNDLPDGEKTIINDNYKLDDDVIQRITLANAFYKDSKIIVSNESTSSLDVRSEDAIMQEIKKLKNKIMIIMSKKSYNMLNCDKILIVDNEKVLEYGKIEELIKDKTSLFSKLIKKVSINKDSKVS